MKKLIKWILIILLVGVFAIMALATVSGDSDSDSTKSITEVDNGETKSGDEDSGNIDETDSEETKAAAVDVTIDEKVLVDKKDIKITALEYVNDDLEGDGIKVLIENNSKKNITVGCNALIVNNYMINDLFAADVAAGKKSNETIYLYNSELEAAGIENVGKVQIYFHIYDSDSYDDILTPKKGCTIKTSAYKDMDTTPKDEGKELYNKKGIRIVGKEVDEDSFWGSAVLLYIENNSKKNVTIQADDMSINGFMVEPYFSQDVYSKKKAISEITIMDSDLEDNGIESIDEIELKFKILNADTYDTIATTKTITMKTK